MEKEKNLLCIPHSMRQNTLQQRAGIEIELVYFPPICNKHIFSLWKFKNVNLLNDTEINF